MVVYYPLHLFAGRYNYPDNEGGYLIFLTGMCKQLANSLILSFAKPMFREIPTLKIGILLAGNCFSKFLHLNYL